MMKIDKIIATFSLFSFIAAMSVPVQATVEVENSDIDAISRNAVTRSDHEAVAKYYENAAVEMQAKAQEQKRLLEQYEDKSYLYGREAQDLQAHTHALTRKYEKEAQANVREATLHRQMASQLAEGDFTSSSGPKKLSLISDLH
jgi:Fe2+ transport system protein B